MKTLKWTLMALTMAGVMGATPLMVSAHTTKNMVPVKTEDVPAPALRTIQEHAKDAPITNVATETKHGKTYYIGHFTKDNKTREVKVKADGKFVSERTEKGSM